MRRGPAPGRQLGRYVLGRKLGAGGMALVYRAHDPALHRELAIKVIRPRLRGDAARDRLLREAQAMARLEHPNVVPVFDVGTTGDDVYLVMPYLAGGTLGEWLASGPRPWRAVLARFLAAGRGLTTAHDKGLVHRDFKPHNVLLGGNGEVRVADFGLAQVAAEATPNPAAPRPPVIPPHLTRTGAVLGTPIYMAPEQLSGGPVSPLCDQFSFCVALWEGLYGERPFRPEPGTHNSDIDALVSAIRRGPPAPPTNGRRVPHRVRVLVARGLRADPAQRWPSLDELLDRLDTRLRRPRRVAAGVAIGAIAAAGVAVAFALAGAGSGAATDRRRDTADGAVVPQSYRTSRITARGRVGDAALSPDGATLAWVVQGDVFVQATGPRRSDPAQARVVLRDAGGATLAFSPGGDRLAVTNPPGRTRVLEVSSGNVLVDARVGLPLLAFAGEESLVYSGRGATLVQRRLAAPTESRECALPASVRSVADLAAAGDELVLTVDRTDGPRGLLRVRPDCSDPVFLRADRWLDPVGAGDGLFYALRRRAGEVSLVALDPSGRVVAMRALDGDVTDLAGVSPDGRAYFVRSEYEWRLVELGRTGGPSELAAGMQPTELAGSPDGRSVAWVEDGDDRRALRIAPAEHMADRPAPIATGVMTVAWARDGRRLAAIVDSGGRHDLVVLDLTGAVLHRLRVTGLDAEDGLAWISASAVVAGTVDHRNLLRIEPATGAIEPLLTDLGDVYDPQTAPDGTIAFTWERDERGASGIWLRAPTGELTRLREDGDGSVHAAWSPSGDRLVLYDRKTGEVWRVELPGDPVRLAPVPLSGSEWLPALWLRDDGRLLAHVARQTSDLHVSRPE